LLELMRVKAGECAEFLVRACDDKGRLDLSSGSSDGSYSSRRSVYSA
ncbi:damage-inducible mutagenesis protein, partial [Rhizobium leguminosarum]|nr:damage-inducible mutagenesis protein [Rhizobium leguminosarum]